MEEDVYVYLPDHGKFLLGDLLETANWLRTLNWRYKKWNYGPALVDINGGIKRYYTGQTYDPLKLKVIDDGWTHDHCEVCWTTISEGNDNSESEIDGYYCEGNWICKKCYHFLIEPENLEETLEKYKKEI
jgi:hypothetical protein